MSNFKKAQLKSLKANILTEHFGFSPEVFAKQGMDLANVSMYNSTNSVLKFLLEKKEDVINEDEITKVSCCCYFIYFCYFISVLLTRLECCAGDLQNGNFIGICY